MKCISCYPGPSNAISHLTNPSSLLSPGAFYARYDAWDVTATLVERELADLVCSQLKSDLARARALLRRQGWTLFSGQGLFVPYHCHSSAAALYAVRDTPSRNSIPRAYLSHMLPPDFRWRSVATRDDELQDAIWRGMTETWCLSQRLNDGICWVEADRHLDASTAAAVTAPATSRA